MAKRNKSDLVGNLINKRKLMEATSSTIEETLPEVVTVEKKQEEKKVKVTQKASENVTKTNRSVQKKAPSKKRGLGEVDSILSDLKEDKKQDKYSSIKIKTELYNRIKKISRKEGIDRHGHLIDRVLTDFCDRYEGK